MNVLLFSDDRILYEDGEKGAIASILIPRYSRIKKYADITAVNDSNVKLRHGDADDLPALWKEEGPYVYVYGNLSDELDEKRNTHSMYLPQDFVGEDVGAFYYIFNDKYVIHGVKSITDDGQRVWGTSLIGEGEGAAIDVVVASISERMLEGKEERVIVAVHKNKESFNFFKEALLPFEQEVILFDDLGMPAKAIKPLFERKDRSIFMLILSLCALLAMLASLFLWGSGQIKLQSVKAEGQVLQDIISKMQKNKALGYIKNPKEIIKLMDDTIPLQPSSLLHNAAVAGAMFGDIIKVEMGSKSKKRKGKKKNRKKKSTYEITVKVSTPPNSLLLDQERIAKAVIESMPWVKYIERPILGSTNELKIGIQVK